VAAKAIIPSVKAVASLFMVKFKNILFIKIAIFGTLNLI
jgi:hypothetical protein